METKFFEFTQNNSGGHFDTDDNVCHRVFIEATDEDHALEIFEPMIENESPSCSCCGDRWYLSPSEVTLNRYTDEGYFIGIGSHYKDAEERWFKFYGDLPRKAEPIWTYHYSVKEFGANVYFDSIEQYCQMLANRYGWTTPDAKIHRLNGSLTEIFKQDMGE